MLVWCADVAVYVALGTTVSVVALVRVLLMVQGSLRASTHLHTVMTRAVLQAPLRFFDVNPTGRTVTCPTWPLDIFIIPRSLTHTHPAQAS